MRAPPRDAADAPPRWARACGREALDARTILPLVVEGRHLILIRDGNAVRAAERACPHEGADLALGRCRGGQLLCPRHMAWFDLRTGAVSQGWSFRPLRMYAARIVDTDIWVGLV